MINNKLLILKIIIKYYKKNMKILIKQLIYKLKERNQFIQFKNLLQIQIEKIL